jgi:hypothetical protein
MVRVTAVVLVAAMAFTMSRCNTSAPGGDHSSPTVTTTGSGTPPPPQDPNATLLLRILQDQTIWGRDFTAVLRALPAFEAAGEETIAVKPAQVVGRHKYRDMESALPAANRASAMTDAAPQQFKVPMRATNATMSAPRPVMLLDDRTVRVGTPEERTEYLVKGVSIDTLIARYGQPDSVTEELLDDGTERRPIGLKVYHFAGGAVAFATADINDDPRWVDRAFLDTRAISRAIF